ncbi:uncharacterized protein N7503_002971 [Penicillium pulvis]|uniref:uncharacterized protein n=1 Tax=Penicillium pulvis TaxID=1562058 RepID=UPI0025471622|nr:uncharacterized protein N7503_002971 [Penicillium pulvis]KAJ5810753.1 hypothetical protein N7503_002971 [Penicillium pulvis]
MLCANSIAWFRPRNAFLTLLHITLATLSFPAPSPAVKLPISQRLPASPGYQGRSSACPTRCAISGPNPANWSMYHNFDQISSCQESLFYSFPFLDPVDDADAFHRIYTCTSFGPDGGNLPANASSLDSQSSGAPSPVNGTYQIGSWPSAPGFYVSSSLVPLVNQFRQYLTNGFGSVNRPTILFASFGSTSIGLYIGQGLQNQHIAYNALAYLQGYIATSSASHAAAVAMQFCQPDQTSHHTFGLIATGNGTFTAIITNSTSTHASATSVRRALAPRTTCSTVQVVSSDSCGSLAVSCGITAAEFTEYNSATDECSTLQVGEHVCCSAGTLPDFAPQPQADGTCATYTIQANDNCATIAAAYSLTGDEIEDYNTDTWAWNGCSLLYPGNIIYLSTEDAPMPAACGTTSDFCTNTGTGAPGTAANGTNGFISNCGTNIVLSSPPATYRSIGHYEGYNLERPCLYQDVFQLDVSSYTHIYYACGLLSSSYVVQIPNATVDTMYEFDLLKQLVGTSRILSIGGWYFSTDPGTYMIFRDGVTTANRLTMATNIADFINDNDLDGVNIDWEYPGITSKFPFLRATAYKGLAMGGTTDWATDLQEYNDAPFTSTSWNGFIGSVLLEVDPYEEGKRTGNWTTLTCIGPAIQDDLFISSAQQWSELDASNASSDTINVWKTIDEPKLGSTESDFCESLMFTWHLSSSINCGKRNGECDTKECADFEGFDAITEAAALYIDDQLDEFEDTFAPVPPAPSDEWLVIFISMVGLGLTAVAAPFFDGVFGALPALVALGDEGAQTAQDITYATIAFGASDTSAALPDDAPGTWTAAAQKNFTATIGSVMAGWSSTSDNALWCLFNGTDTSITQLTTIIANGNFVPSGVNGSSSTISSTTDKQTTSAVAGFISKALFGFAIPAVWDVVGTPAFIIDSGYPCSAQNPLSDYMTADT